MARQNGTSVLVYSTFCYIIHTRGNNEGTSHRAAPRFVKTVGTRCVCISYGIGFMTTLRSPIEAYCYSIRQGVENMCALCERCCYCCVNEPSPPPPPLA